MNVWITEFKKILLTPGGHLDGNNDSVHEFDILFILIYKYKIDHTHFVTSKKNVWMSRMKIFVQLRTLRLLQLLIILQNFN